MALTGHLSDLALAELIEFFCNQRKTGQLKVLYPQGPGYFYLQTGSVIDAKIGVLRGIDAVYYALTLPNAKFEFSGTEEASERTINQPWTQVVLEGLRRLDEGIEPPDAFPDTYIPEDTEVAGNPNVPASLLGADGGPAFAFMQSEGAARRKFFVMGGVAVAVLASVAVIGVPAGWYSRSKASPPPVETTKVVQPEPTPIPVEANPSPEAESAATANEDQAQAEKRQREREQARREEKAKAAETAKNAETPQPVQNFDTGKGGSKKVTVTVTYDESGRVTQASGGDATAVRIARQKRFPAGKAGSATITIPIN